MRWIDQTPKEPMDVVVASQVPALKAQMASPLSEPAPAADLEGDQMSQMMRTFITRGRRR